MPQDSNPSRLWLLPARRVEALVGYLRHRHLAVMRFFWTGLDLGHIGDFWLGKNGKGKHKPTGSGGGGNYQLFQMELYETPIKMAETNWGHRVFFPCTGEL